MSTTDNVVETLRDLLAASNPGLVSQKDLAKVEERLDALGELVDEIEERLDSLAEAQSK